MQNIRNRGGRIFNTGTPWHPEDAFSIMPPPKQFDCYSTGLITEAELKEIRASMVPSLFAANYELRHIAAEDLIFTDPQTGVDPAKAEQADACHVDAAYGGGDGTAFTVCRKYGGKYYVFGKLWQRHVFGCLPEIVDLRKAFKAGIIYCEANGDHGYLARDLRELGERVITYHEDTNKFLKIASHLKGAWKDVVFGWCHGVVDDSPQTLAAQGAWKRLPHFSDTTKNPSLNSLKFLALASLKAF